MRSGRHLGVALLLSIVAACSNKPECFVADTLKEISVKTLNQKGVYVFLRTSGFSEKEHFFEMYNDLPKFDDCGQPRSEPISQVHVDTSIGYPQKLLVGSDRLEIVYSDDENNKPNDTISIDVE